MICFRYPGGKTKIKNEIVGRVKRYYEENDCYDVCQYVEPFFGAGAIGLNLMESTPLKRALISDADPAICAFWDAVVMAPPLLCQMVEEFDPSVESFFKFKELLTSDEMSGLTFNSSWRFVEVGFAKLALHQISYSGLGTMAGGPLGGVKQESKYKIDCRWNPDSIIKKIKKAHQILSSVDLYRGGCLEIDFSCAIDLQKELRDWEEMFGIKPEYEIEDINSRFFYLDPPYYEKGGELYQYSFTEQHHEDLMRMLKRTEHPWLLSYDSCPEIKELYSWASIMELDLTYTINAKEKGRVKTEYLIAPPEHSNLLEELRENDIFE